MTEQPNLPLSYEQAGVNLTERRRIVARYRDVARGAARPEVLDGIGPFAGLFALGNRYKDPVLVSTTDGVGTKTKIAALVERYEALGHDIVANCVNDAITSGAEPIFFLDYIGSTDLSADAKVAIVKGIADACTAVGCALLGGETADMPGVYPAGEFDLVGFVVGVAERSELLDASRIVAGDVLFGLPSNGLHTNGYSLVRSALGIAVDGSDRSADRERLERFEDDLGESLADALLRPHLCYYNRLKPGFSLLKGIAHITGGGVHENVPRILPNGLAVTLDKESWPQPPVFHFIQSRGQIEEAEMYHVFNMGLGIVMAVSPNDASELQRRIPQALVVGEVNEIAPGSSRVTWR